jgi:hypothetical protein
LLDFRDIPRPLAEDLKFEFQLHRYAIAAWKDSNRVEERMLAHCKYIHTHAVAIQSDKELRNKLWKFDKPSHLFWNRKDQKLFKMTGVISPHT